MNSLVASLRSFEASKRKILPLRELDSRFSDKVIVKFQSGIVVLENKCPHNGLPLSNARVSGDILTCKWHACRFGLKNTDLPEQNKLQASPTEIKNLEMLIADEIKKIDR